MKKPLRFGHSRHAFRARAVVPDAPNLVFGLSYIIAISDANEFDEDDFPGALLWLRNWEIGSESIERVGYSLVTAMRREPRLGLKNQPAHLFMGDEFVTAQTMLSLPLLFQWDASFVSARADLVAEISHEGFVDLSTTSSESLQALIDRLKQYSLEIVKVQN